MNIPKMRHGNGLIRNIQNTVQDIINFLPSLVIRGDGKTSSVTTSSAGTIIHASPQGTFGKSSKSASIKRGNRLPWEVWNDNEKIYVRQGRFFVNGEIKNSTAGSWQNQQTVQNDIISWNVRDVQWNENHPMFVYILVTKDTTNVNTPESFQVMLGPTPYMTCTDQALYGSDIIAEVYLKGTTITIENYNNCVPKIIITSSLENA